MHQSEEYKYASLRNKNPSLSLSDSFSLPTKEVTSFVRLKDGQAEAQKG